MSNIDNFHFRLGKDELFVAAPYDDAHKIAFTSVAPDAKYDDIMKEWRVPWDSSNETVSPEKFVKNVQNTVQRTTSKTTVSGLPTVSGQIYGYAQVTHGEGPEEQIDALRKFGIPDERIFFDRLEGRYPKRLKLDECLNKLRPGDMFVVFYLNRLARSLKQLAETFQQIVKNGAHVYSLNESIDTRLPQYDRFIENISYAAAFEQEAISVRTKAGLREAKSKGRKGGGRRSKLTKENIEKIVELAIKGDFTDEEVAHEVGVSRATLYRYLPVKMEEIRKTHKQRGMAAVQGIIDEMVSRLKAGGMTDAKKEEILRLYHDDYSIQWITDHTGFNRETVRAVIEEAYK